MKTCDRKINIRGREGKGRQKRKQRRIGIYRDEKNREHFKRAKMRERERERKRVSACVCERERGRIKQNKPKRDVQKKNDIVCANGPTNQE